MNQKPQAVSRARVLEPKWKHVIENEGMFRLTFWERVKVLFGHNIEFKYEAKVTNSPGHISPSLLARVVNKL